MKRFGEIVRSHRQALGMTLERLARKVGTHKGYVSGWENGKVRPPSPRITLKLAKVLGLNADAMIILGWVEKAPARVREEIRKRVVDWREYPPAPPLPDRLSADEVGRVREMIGSGS